MLRASASASGIGIGERGRGRLRRRQRKPRRPLRRRSPARAPELGEFPTREAWPDVAVRMRAMSGAVGATRADPLCPLPPDADLAAPIRTLRRPACAQPSLRPWIGRRTREFRTPPREDPAGGAFARWPALCRGSARRRGFAELPGGALAELGAPTCVRFGVFPRMSAFPSFPAEIRSRFCHNRSLTGRDATRLSAGRCSSPSARARACRLRRTMSAGLLALATLAFRLREPSPTVRQPSEEGVKILGLCDRRRAAGRFRLPVAAEGRPRFHPGLPAPAGAGQAGA